MTSGKVSSAALIAAVFLLAGLLHSAECKKTVSTKDVISVDDLKAFKKLIKEKTNVLTLFGKNAKVVNALLPEFAQAATAVKGQGTMVTVDCSKNKKMCKRLDVSGKQETSLKHYLNGEYHKEYDRLFRLKSFVSFMKTPKAEAPWEENSDSVDVRHVDSAPDFQKLIQKETKPILFMFYVPWCGFCKKLKPEYAQAATELQKQAVLGAMDIDLEEAYGIRQMFNITGFPTLIYFKGGEQMPYGGERTKDGIIAWMKDPKPAEPKEEEKPWSAEENEVVHLTTADFDEYMDEHSSVLVMFYAPWCGHCKAMKPEYVSAAAALKEEGSIGILAAVDCTKENGLAERFGVKGFPTVRYFQNGTDKWGFDGRREADILEFMRDPKEPPPPPPPEPEWSEVTENVLHLNSKEEFRTQLKRKKHALVFFYAPWCGHCKKAKPEFSGAADRVASNKVAMAAVDCTAEGNKDVCEEYEVRGYPTIIYTSYLKTSFKYKGGRTESDFVAFMEDPREVEEPPPEPEWKDVPSNVVHLTDSTFDEYLSSHPSTLIMFYAPWCGHCKAMKPQFVTAADTIVDTGMDASLAAVDCTRETALATRFEVRGYPTIKFFANGPDDSQDYTSGRTADDIIRFLKNPVPASKPELITEWSSDVSVLTTDNFAVTAEATDSMLVMFYAPWCGHCHKTQPAFQAAAAQLANDDSRVFAAVDCVANSDLCSRYGVSGYPTFKSFARSADTPTDYTGGRSTADFLMFFSNQAAGKERTEL